MADEGTMAKLCEVETDWVDVAEELRDMEEALPCMAAVFAVGLRQIKNSGTANIIEKHIAELQGKDLTVAGFQAQWALCSAELAAINVDPHDPVPNLVVKFTYRRQLTTQVGSYFNLWEFHKEALVRQTALENGLLDPLFCEAELHPIAAAVAPVKIEPPLLSRAVKVRIAAAEMLPLAQTQTQANIKEVFSKRLATLKLYDKYVLIEKAFFDKYMNGGEIETVNALVLSKLPKEGRDVDIQVALDGLTVLSGAKLMKFVGNSPSAALEQVRKWVQQLSKKTEPSFADASPTLLFSKAKEALARFLKHTDPETVETTYGAEAVDPWLDQLRSLPVTQQDEKNFLYSQIGMVTRFGWLLQPHQAKELALKKTALSGRGERKRLPVGSPKLSPNDKKKAKKDLGATIVDNMFNQTLSS